MKQSVQQTVGTTPVRAWVGGEGAPLVYLHGFEQHPGGAGFLTRLAQGRQVLAPEHPGFGGTGGFDSLVDILDLVLHYRDYLEPLVARHGGPVDLVGHSLGGMFAAEIAAICPDLVRKLVLVNSYGLWLDDHPQPDPFVILPAELRAAKWANPEAWADKEPNSHDGPAAEFMFYRNQNLGAASKFMWPIPDRGLSRRLRHVRAETLIVHGKRDGLLPTAYAHAFAKAIPGSRVVMIDGAGHLPMIEAEDVFVRTLQEFLQA
ncbi:MAG: alpha/beta hydrolase [Gemmobacter sp.]|nr:alpha/beta hydrolase [Gemmobacter sp.]